jgi:hypothetical protein
VNVAAVLLQYGDEVTRRGVTLDRQGDGVCIRVPARAAQRVGWMLGVVVGVVLVVTQVGLFALNVWRQATVMAFLFLVAMCGVAVGFWVPHLRRQVTGGPDTVIEVNGRELRLIVPIQEGGQVVFVRPRTDVTEVRYNPYEGALLVRAPGHELLPTLLQGEDERVIRWVAEQVRAELGLDGEGAV